MGNKIFNSLLGATSAAPKMLDGLSNLWGAYGCYKLRTAYAGPAIRIKDAANAELDINFNASGILDLTTLSGGTPYRVITVYDQSGNSRDATSSPTYHGATSTTLRLDTTNKNLRFADCYLTLPDMSALTAAEIFIAAKHDTDPKAAGTGLWDMSATAHAPYVPFSDSNVYDDWGSSARKNASFNTAGVMASRHVYSVWSAANDWGQWLNGSLKFSTATNTVLFKADPIFGRVTTGGAGEPFLTGNLDAMVIFSAKVAGATRTALHAGL